jgi:hypothetical protein
VKFDELETENVIDYFVGICGNGISSSRSALALSHVNLIILPKLKFKKIAFEFLIS